MWFSKSTEAVLKELSVDPAVGLSDEEALTRLKKYGVNKLKAEKKKSIFLMFFEQLRNWLIYILLGAVVITVFMGEYVDAVIILLVININALLGVFQEVKAGKAIEALQKLTFPKALVRRNGAIHEIDSEKIVSRLGKKHVSIMKHSMKSFAEHVSKAHHSMFVDFIIPLPIHGLTK